MDYGLLGGIGNMLSSGAASYTAQKDKQRAAAQAAEEMALRKRQQNSMEFHEGVQTNPDGTTGYTESYLADKARKQAQEDINNKIKAKQDYIQIAKSKGDLLNQGMEGNEETGETNFTPLGLTMLNTKQAAANREKEAYDPNSEYSQKSRTFSKGILGSINPKLAASIPEGFNAKDLEEKTNSVLLGEAIKASSDREKAAKEKAAKILPATEAASIGMANSATQALNDVSSLVKSNSDIVGPIKGRWSGLLGSMQMGEGGRRAASLNAEMKQRSQTIGKYLEGGKLAEGDIKRYIEQLPQLPDSPEVAEAKIQSLNRLIAQKQKGEYDAFAAAGYDTGNLPLIQNTPGLRQNKGMVNKSSQPKSVVQNGHTYILNEKTGKYE